MMTHLLGSSSTSHVMLHLSIKQSDLTIKQKMRINWLDSSTSKNVLDLVCRPQTEYKVWYHAVSWLLLGKGIGWSYVQHYYSLGNSLLITMFSEKCRQKFYVSFCWCLLDSMSFEKQKQLMSSMWKFVNTEVTCYSVTCWAGLSIFSPKQLRQGADLFSTFGSL